MEIHGHYKRHNSIIEEEFEKLYAPVTQRHASARIPSGLKKSKKEMAKTR